MQKREIRDEFKVQYKAREAEIKKFINSNENKGKDNNWRVSRKVDEIKDMTGSGVKRNHILKVLDDESQFAGKIDVSFFKVMELNLNSDHQAQVNAALEQFMAKANLAKKSEQLKIK